MARVPEACRQHCRDCHADYGKPCGTPQKPSPRSDFFLVRELSRDQQQDRQVGRKCVVLLVRGERKKDERYSSPGQTKQFGSGAKIQGGSPSLVSSTLAAGPLTGYRRPRVSPE